MQAIQLLSLHDGGLDNAACVTSIQAAARPSPGHAVRCQAHFCLSKPPCVLCCRPRWQKKAMQAIQALNPYNSSWTMKACK